MNENKEMIHLLKKQLFFTRIVALILIIAVVAAGACVYTMGPRVQQIVSDAESVSQNLNQVSRELTEADLAGMFDNVNGLVSTSEKTVTEAADKLNQVDFEALNKAIADLQKVVEPLAKLFK